LSATCDASGDAGERFLAALPLPERANLPFRTAVVVAHPDDETIGCGAQLPRFSYVTVIHLTDGAPRSLTDAKARGFATAEAYAAARSGELRAAMGLAGISERLVALGWPDQESAQHLDEIATELSKWLAGTDIVLTHAYEGGHPDHDTAALAVWAACALLRRAGESAPAVIEMPLYHLGQEGWMRQVFVPATGPEEIAVELTPEERRLKREMFAAHASQADVLANFGTAVERFRRAPRYDFSRLPNGGKLLYEDWNWGINGARWLKYSQAALAELGLGGAA
jgi:N-acetylglucosamine malate deacetylase 2